MHYNKKSTADIVRVFVSQALCKASEAKVDEESDLQG